MPGIGEIDYFTNASIMDVDFLPEHLIIIGGSYIGLEFAQMYRRFGSRVTVVQKGDQLIPRDDGEVSEAVKDILENEGIDHQAAGGNTLPSPSVMDRSWSARRLCARR